MKRYVSPSVRCRSRSRLMTCAPTETSSALTGSSSTRKLGPQRQGAGDVDALALAAGELMRIARQGGVVEADGVQQFGAAARADLRGGGSRWMAKGSARIWRTDMRGLSAA